MNRLILCCGIHKRPGWKTLDANLEHHPDFLATIPPLPREVREQFWDEVEWVHGITSVYPWEAREVLCCLYRYMRPGGKLVLEQPDFRKAVERVDWLYGDPSLKDPLIMNKWAYTPDSLSAMVLECGFNRVEISEARHHMPDRDFRLEAWR